VRRGRRVGTPTAVLHVVNRGSSEPGRFGFIVTKAVGNAVVRNTVRRRLRAVCRNLVGLLPAGTDVVIRALPGSQGADWVSLHSEIADGVERAVSRG